MHKEFNFQIQEHQIRVTNSWLHGMKLYLNGQLQDWDKSFGSYGKHCLMSANMGELGVLEIYPNTLLTVEIDAYLIKGDTKVHVYSSHKRISKLWFKKLMNKA